MNKAKLEILKQDSLMSDRAELIEKLLNTIPGVDTESPSLQETPWRVAKLFSELFCGYGMSAEEILTDAIFADVPADDLVVVKDIPLHSTCGHHMLPFFGTVTVAYIPKENKVVGISKLARVVEVFSRRLQEQERIGHDIAGAIEKYLDPIAVAVIITAEHTCMTTRGARAIGSKTTTSCLKGLFKYDDKARAELYSAIKL